MTHRGPFQPLPFCDSVKQTNSSTELGPFVGSSLEQEEIKGASKWKSTKSAGKQGLFINFWRMAVNNGVGVLYPPRTGTGAQLCWPGGTGSLGRPGRGLGPGTPGVSGTRLRCTPSLLTIFPSGRAEPWPAAGRTPVLFPSTGPRDKRGTADAQHSG